MGTDWAALGKVEENHREIVNLFPELQGSHYVPGEGDNAEAFIIGEAPGAQEDMNLRPFVGDSGQILRDLMGIAELFSTPSHCGPPYQPNCWLTNVVKFRPPRNRTPTDMEIKAFRRLLFDEWLAVGGPRLIIPVGGTALYAVTGKRMSILRAAGRCHNFTDKQGTTMHLWPMVHPSFALRAGDDVQKIVETDWERLGAWRQKQSG